MRKKMSTQGLELQIEAGKSKKTAREYRQKGCLRSEEFYDMKASRLEHQAERLLEPLLPAQIGSGTEAIPDEIQCRESYAAHCIKETLTDPGQVNLDASLSRTELLSDCGLLDLGIDAAESIEAKNSLEKMLVHQMAGCHKMALSLLAKAAPLIENSNPHDLELSNQQMEMVSRMTNATCRLIDTYHRGYQTLIKARTGGTQVIQHQYVQVNADGGQTVFTTQMAGGSGEDEKRK